MVESLDNGKPIRETMAVDIPLSAQHFRCRPDRSLELPLPDGRLETGPCAGQRLLHRF